MKILLLFLVAMSASAGDTQIVFPDTQVSTSVSSAIWLTTDPVSEGTSVKLVAFEYDWRPVTGLITVDRVGGVATIFRDGFEGGVVPLANGGVIDSTWWTPRTGPGPAGWETDRTIAILPTGRYKVEVYFDNGATGTAYTGASFTVTVP